MNIRICYLNPNHNGPPTLELEGISGWATVHGELHIFRSNSATPAVVFAARQWVWAEELPDNTSTAPVRANRPENPNKPVHSDRPADFRDYSTPTAESVEANRRASERFARERNTVAWSTAHMKALHEFEDWMFETRGEEGLNSLPWRNVPRGESAHGR